jgi:hypothetical protein
MRIQCKNCGVYFTIDQQDAATHTGLCDRCLNTLPVSAKFEGDAEVSVERKTETKAEKKARQKAELEEAKALEEDKISQEQTPQDGIEGGQLASPEDTISSSDQSELPKE